MKIKTQLKKLQKADPDSTVYEAFEGELKRQENIKSTIEEELREAGQGMEAFLTGDLGCGAVSQGRAIAYRRCLNLINDQKPKTVLPYPKYWGSEF